MTASHSPLFSDLLVIELASVLAGPSVGMFLAELGARVIKVENPQTGGDVTRSWQLASESADDDRPAYFCAVNWGKESIALNLKAAADQQTLRQLLAKADVLITSFIPGKSARMGLDPESLQRDFPNLIIAEVSGYGPDEARAAFDAIIQAEAGFTYLNGIQGQVNKMPVALMDVLAAHQLKEAVLLAYIHRLKSGRGSLVHVSLLQSGLSSLANQATNWLHAGQVPQPKGSDHPNIVPYGTMFQTADHQQVVMAVGNDTQFAALCRLLGEEVPPQFARNHQRVKQPEEVKAWLAPLIGQYTRDEFLQRCQEALVPVGAVNDMQAAWEHTQAQELKLQHEEVAGLRSLVATGSVLSQLHLSPPPHFNEQGPAILAEFGIEA